MSKNYDTRELQERLDELESDFATWEGQLTDDEKKEIADNWGEDVDECTLKNEWFSSTSDGAEYESIQNLKDEIGSSWNDGVYLIGEDNFEEYAKQFAEDIGAISGDEHWPATCIDWEKAASELQFDYSSVEFDGETYWYRE